MMKFIRTHPFFCVLVLAALVRLCSVVWSRGFIQSDDYYDTVTVAHTWLTQGFWGEDGFLRWNTFPSTSIGRFPLYALSLFGIMRLLTWFGLESLDAMMYGIRAVHALVSLLPVWALYRITRQVTGRDSWGMAAGLIAGLHFAMPFLGVRNLIEMVGGCIWITAILFLYRYREDHQLRWLWLAGLVSGLAWMIRFQTAFAVLPIPFVLWYEDRSWRPAVSYSIGVAIMLFLAGLIDLFLLGRFAGSTLTNLTINTGLGPMYKTIPVLYPALLLLLLVPPFSVVAAWFMFSRSFVRRHLVLVVSFLSFLLWHMGHANQQERFIFPMLPVAFLMAILALWQRYQDKGYILKSATLVRTLCGISIVINLVLLAPLTFAYGHKGLIESVLTVRRLQPDARVLYLQPGMRYYVPVAYADPRSEGTYIRNWSELPPAAEMTGEDSHYDFAVIFPTERDPLAACRDTLSARYGQAVLVEQIQPSFFDALLHRLNPRHNDAYESFIYRMETP